MLSRVSNSTVQYDGIYMNSSVREAKKFEDYLAETKSNTKPTVSNKVVEDAIAAMQKQVGVYDYHNKTELNIPDSWVTEGSDKSGVKAAEEFLAKNGIKIKDIIPTHQITEEQMEWLKSRHDLSNMELHMDTPECQNLYGDLTVLGICTFDEIKKLFLVALPEDGLLSRAEPADLGINGLGVQKGSGSLKQVFNRTVDMQQAILSAFMESRGNRPLSALSEKDQKFVNNANELLSKKQEMYDLLLGLFE